MTEAPSFREIGVSRDGHVATVEMHLPPHNFFDSALSPRSARRSSGSTPIPSAALSSSPPKGARFAPAPISRSAWIPARSPKAAAAPRAAISTKRRSGCSHQKAGCRRGQGAAIGGGLGLALVADFRVTCQEARFSANFNRLGFHPGFGLTATLPRLVGAQQAALLFYTGRRIPGDEAVRIGLADLLVPQAEVRSAAEALAFEIAQSARSPSYRPAIRCAAGLSMLSKPRPSAGSSSRTRCAARRFSGGHQSDGGPAPPHFRGR